MGHVERTFPDAAMDRRNERWSWSDQAKGSEQGSRWSKAASDQAPGGAGSSAAGGPVARRFACPGLGVLRDTRLRLAPQDERMVGRPRWARIFVAIGPSLISATALGMRGIGDVPQPYAVR